ncbi:hypothetical protein BD770DRAFT_432612 [Pilaira anomala]|nr:hypothetical protein BD770DRAFT_432612 [Pilaira anomala]
MQNIKVAFLPKLVIDIKGNVKIDFSVREESNLVRLSSYRADMIVFILNSIDKLDQVIERVEVPTVPIESVQLNKEAVDLSFEAREKRRRGILDEELQRKLLRAVGLLSKEDIEKTGSSSAAALSTSSDTRSPRSGDDASLMDDDALMDTLMDTSGSSSSIPRKE